MGKSRFVLYISLALMAFIAQQLPAPGDLGLAVQTRDAAAAGMNAWKSTAQKMVTPCGGNC